jgi:hypothetical protein
VLLLLLLLVLRLISGLGFACSRDSLSFDLIHSLGCIAGAGAVRPHRGGTAASAPRLPVALLRPSEGAACCCCSHCRHNCHYHVTPVWSKILTTRTLSSCFHNSMLIYRECNAAVQRFTALPVHHRKQD